MSFRFRRTLKVFPGLRLNISRAGISASVGPRGASVTFGKNGNYLNLGLPGSGLSYRTKLGSRTNRTVSAADEHEPTATRGYPASVDMRLNNKFELELINRETRRRLSQVHREGFLFDWEDEALEFLQEKADELNQAIEAVGRPHLARVIEDPIRALVNWDEYVKPDAEFNHVSPPPLPGPKSNADSRRRRSALNSWLAQSMSRAETTSSAWRTYASNRADKRRTVASLRAKIDGDEYSFRSALIECLDAVEWPRDTQCQTEVFWTESETEVIFNVDLPEHDDLPAERFAIDAGAFILERRSIREEEAETMWQLCVISIVAALIQLAFNLSSRVTQVSVRGFRDLPEEDEILSLAPQLQLTMDRMDYVWNRNTDFRSDDLRPFTSLQFAEPK